MDDVTAKIRDVDLAAVIAGEGVSLKRGGGGRLVGLCPLHGEKSPSFTVYPDKNSFYCFGCGAGGDAAEFMMKLHNIEFPEALRRIGVDGNGKKPSKRPGRVPVVKKAEKEDAKSPVIYDRPPDLWIEKATAFSGWCQDQLLKNTEQLKWLADRGIDRKAVIASRLGWNPGESDDKPQFFRHRHSWGLPDEIKPNGKKKMLWLPRGLVIPLVASNGVVRLRIRGEQPRYYVVPGSNMNLMVINGDHRCLTIVESELDAIMLTAKARDLSGYMALGSSHAKPDGAADFYLRHASHIILALDYDDAGAKALQWWGENYPRAVVWPLPAGKDPGEAFSAGVDLREWILAAYPDGWNLQRSWRKRRPAKKVEPVLKEPRRKELPPDVGELAKLITGAPVTIYITRDQLKIISPPEWNHANWERFGRISQLVYFTPVVYDYLTENYHGKITYKHFETTNAKKHT